MINSVLIEGYRGFRHFELHGLGRITLLVGRNNSGKSSVLEALYLLATRGDPFALWNMLARRGELFQYENIPGRPVLQEMDVSHIFYGHDLKLGSVFKIATANETPDIVACSVVQPDVKDLATKFGSVQIESEVSGGASRALLFDVRGVGALVPLTKRGGFRQDVLQVAINAASGRSSSETIPTQFISTGSLSVNELVNSWSGIVLTDQEDRVVSTLRALEPKIERIATVGNTAYLQGNVRGGFIVKSQGAERPVPIGSFGDGMWRLLALAIGVGRAKDGILFVDEIDTGLHYSAMTSMWSMLYSSAKQLNLQVFATTHNYDCVRSLAEICDESAVRDGDITIQRLDQTMGQSVAYTAKQIKIAALQDIEVR
jgi:energy-coupling factor transporter ATP-binding protein EcfA2